MMFGKREQPEETEQIVEKANVPTDNMEFSEVRKALIVLLNDPAVTLQKVDLRRKGNGKYKLIIRATQTQEAP